MSPKTIAALNQINRTFYQQTAPYFDATRQAAWAGWSQILDHLPASRPLRVFDVGCGNGRFGSFLQAADIAFQYTGIDNNPTLLAAAKTTLPNTAELIEADILTTPPVTHLFDLVVLFGVIHHIPGYANRLQFMERLASCVAPSGLLVFAAWRFYDNPRFQERTQPWIDSLEREPGDYLLDWKRGTVALRYCHHVDDTEHDRLVAITGFIELARYRADGKDQQTNQYSILKCPDKI